MNRKKCSSAPLFRKPAATGFPSRLAASLCALTALAGTSTAQTWVVSSLSDEASVPDGVTLRQAILEVNSYSGGEVPLITFADDLEGTIHLQSMLPVITNPNGLTIEGNGKVTLNGATADSGGGDRVFFLGVNAADSTLLSSTESAQYRIANLTIVGGNARGGDGGNGFSGGGGGAGLGGAVFLNAGTLTLSGVNLENNRATGGNGGSWSGSYGFGGGGGMGGRGGAELVQNMSGAGAEVLDFPRPAEAEPGLVFPRNPDRQVTSPGPNREEREEVFFLLAGKSAAFPEEGVVVERLTPGEAEVAASPETMERFPPVEGEDSEGEMARPAPAVAEPASAAPSSCAWGRPSSSRTAPFPAAPSREVRQALDLPASMVPPVRGSATAYSPPGPSAGM